MEFINKTINLECKGKLHPILVYEEFLVNPLESTNMMQNGTEDCSSIAGYCRVRKASLPEVNCKRKEDDDEVAVGCDMSAAVMTPSNEVALRKGLTHCCSREKVDTVVEDSLCDVELSRPSAVGVQEVMMKEHAPYLKSYDEPLRCVEQVLSPGILKSLSGPLDGLGPGINLEVDLGHPLGVHSINNPLNLPSNSQITRPSCNNPPGCNSHAPSKSTRPHTNGDTNGLDILGLHDQAQVGPSVITLNHLRPIKKPGKKKAQMEGFSRFARFYGHKAVALAKHSSKAVSFRPATAALAHSDLSKGNQACIVICSKKPKPLFN
ncbi:hypothetical protein ACSBR1_003301 [Camellia fascicularis]